jgi:hypothetical protein
LIDTDEADTFLQGLREDITDEFQKDETAA